MPRLQGCAGGAREILGLADGQRLESAQPYFRYWAGYTVLARPVLALAAWTTARSERAVMLAVALA